MNWLRYIIEYGQVVAVAAILASLAGSILLLRKYYRKQLAWAPVILVILLVYKAGGFLVWAQAKVNPLKPVFRTASKAAPDRAFAISAFIPSGSARILCEDVSLGRD